MIRLFFLIRSFGHGGAERQLVTLLNGIDKTRFHVTVAVFYDKGPFIKEVQAIPDIKLILLHKQGRWDTIPFLWRLWNAISNANPDVIHSYMATSNILSLIPAKVLGAKVVWGLRTSNLDLAKYNWITRLMFYLQQSLATFADLTVANSHAGKEYHVAKGFPNQRTIVIPNGIDTERFKPDAHAGLHVRQELGIKKNTRIIGLIGRIDPMKDFAFLLHALACEPDMEADLLIAGDGPEREALQALTDKLRLQHRVHWAGNLADPLPAYQAMDVMVLPSVYEPFGNVVPEAMAAGKAVLGRRRDGNPSRPVLVANDELIQHDRTGWLVDAHDPRDLGCQLRALAKQPQKARQMGLLARQAMQQAQWHHATERYLSLLDIESQANHAWRSAA